MYSSLEAQIIRILATATKILNREDNPFEFNFKDDEEREQYVSSQIENAYQIVKENIMKPYVTPLLESFNSKIIPSETFVFVAEVALKARKYDTVKECLQNYFLQSPEQNSQFFVRALICKAQVTHATGKVESDKQIAFILSCLEPLMESISICMQDKSKFSFLVHDCSVHYWNIARKLFRYGAREYLVPSLTKFIQALSDIDDDICWRVIFLMNLALCQDEMDKVENAISSINAASELLIKHSNRTVDSEEFKVYLADELFKLQIHINRRNLRKSSQYPTSSDNKQKCIAYIQYAKSAITADRQQIIKDLSECYNILQLMTAESQPLKEEKKQQTPAKGKGNQKAEKKPVNKKQYTVTKPTEEALFLFGELGLLCLFQNPPILDIAQNCLKKIVNSTSLITQIFREYIRGYIMVAEIPDNERERLTQKMLNIRSKAVSILEKAIDNSIWLTIHMNSHKNAFLGAELTDYGCLILWNICIPIMQTNLRPKIIAALQKIADSLEKIDSNQHELRTAVHLEIAKCNIANDSLTQASKQVDIALTFDYKAEFLTEEEKQSFKMNRPLDRYLVPLKHKLDLQVSLYKLPESHEDEAFLLVQQAKASSSIHLRENILNRAITLMEILMKEKNQFDSIRYKYIMELWSEILKATWTGESKKIITIARKACSYILDNDKLIEWDVMIDKEMIINEALACFIYAESQILSLNDDGLSLDLPFSLAGDLLSQEEISKIIEAQLAVLEYIEKGVMLGKKAKQDWIVINGCIYLWNYHLPLYRDWKMFYPYVDIFTSCYESLMEVRQRSLITESGYPPNAVHPHHLILIRISYAFLNALIQQYLLSNDSIELFTVGSSGVKLEKIYKQPYKNIFHSYEMGKVSAESKKTDPKTSFSTAPKTNSQQKTSVLTRALTVCEQVIPIFASTAREKRNDTKTDNRTKNILPSNDEEKSSLLMLVKDIICLRSKILVLTQSFSKGVTPLTAEPIEKVIANIGLLDAPIIPTNEKENLLFDAYKHMTQCSPQNPELCAKLSEHALSLGNKNLVLDISKLCDNSLPKSCFILQKEKQKQEYELTERQWRWYSLSTYYCGKALSLFVKDAQDQQTKMKFRVASMMKFVLAMKFCHLSKEKDIGIMIAESFLKEISPVMAAASTSVAKMFYYQSLTEPLDLILYYASFAVKDLSINSTLEEEVLRKNKLASDIIEKLYSSLFMCLRESREFKRGLSIIKQGLSHLSLTHHKVFRQSEIEFRSRLGESIQNSISYINGYDKKTQALVWLELGRCSVDKTERRNAYKQAISILESDTSPKVDCMIEYAQWLYINNYPVQECQDLLMEAIDFLNIIDENAIDFAAFEGSKSIKSKRSLTNSFRSAKMSNLSKRQFQRSKNSKASVVLSMKSVETEIQDEQGPLTIRQQFQMVMANFILSQIVEDPKESMDYCLNAQFYVLRIITSSVNILKMLSSMFDIPEECASLSFHFPSYPQDWIGYEIPTKIRELWRLNDLTISKKEEELQEPPEWFDTYVYHFFLHAPLNSCKQLIRNRTINVESVPSPQYTLIILQNMVERLMQEGFNIHCLPILILMQVISNDIMNDKHMTDLIYLNLSNVYGHMNDLENCKRYRNQAEDLQIDNSIQQRLHEEHEFIRQKRQNNLLKTTSNSTVFEVEHIGDFLPIRRIWIEQAKLLVDGITGVYSISEFTIAKALLQEALVDSMMSEDWYSYANCTYLMSRICELQGQREVALQLLHEALGLMKFDAVSSINVGISLRFYRKCILLLLSIHNLDQKDHQNMFETINSSMQLFTNLLNNKNQNGRNHILFELSMMQNQIGELILDNIHFFQNEPSIGSLLKNLFHNCVTNLEGISYSGILYIRAINNLVKVELIYISQTESELFNNLLHNSELIKQAKNHGEKLLIETLPAGLNTEIQTKQPIVHTYAKTLLLSCHIELLLQELELVQMDKQDSKENIICKTLGTTPKNLKESGDEIQAVLNYLTYNDSEDERKNQASSKLLSRVETALTQVTSALNITNCPVLRAESRYYIGKCFHANIKTEEAFSKLKGVESEYSNILETKDSMINHMKECIAECESLLKSGVSLVNVLQILSLASIELAEYYMRNIEDAHLATTYIIVCQSCLCAIDMLQVFEQYSFNESIDMCFYRLLKRHCVDKEWGRVKDIHSKLIEMSPCYRNIANSVSNIQTRSSLDEILLLKDSAILLLLSLSDDMSSKQGFMIARISSQKYLYIGLVAKNLPTEKSNVSTDEASLSSKSISRVKRIIFVKEHFERILSDTTIIQESRDSTSRGKIATPSGSAKESKIQEKVEGFMVPIFDAFPELRSHKENGLRKLIIITHNDKMQQLFFEELGIFRAVEIPASDSQSSSSSNAGFKCVSRDFSVMLYEQRMRRLSKNELEETKSNNQKSSSTKNSSKPNTRANSRKDEQEKETELQVITPNWTKVYYIIDPQDEDQSNSKKANRDTIGSDFEKLSKELSNISSNWKGIKPVPNITTKFGTFEIQQLFNQMKEEKERHVLVSQCLKSFVSSIIPNMNYISNLPCVNLDLVVIMDQLDPPRDANMDTYLILAKMFTIRGISTIVTNKFKDKEQVNILDKLLRSVAANAVDSKVSKTSVKKATTKTVAKNIKNEQPVEFPPPSTAGIIAESLFQIRNSIGNTPMNAIVFGIP